VGTSWQDFEENVNKSLKSFKGSVHGSSMTSEEAAMGKMLLETGAEGTLIM